MNENENSKMDTAITAVKTTATIAAAVCVTAMAVKGTVDLARDWKEEIRERRNRKKAPIEK